MAKLEKAIQTKEEIRQALIDQGRDIPKTMPLSKYASEIRAVEGSFTPDLNNWKDVQTIVRSGRARDYFEVGDQFQAVYDGQAESFNIIGIDHDVPSDKNFTHSLTIQSNRTLLSSQFSGLHPRSPIPQRQDKGSNNYMESPLRQWLNSDEESYTWVKQGEYDDEPNRSSNFGGSGFLYLLSSDLLDVLGKVDKQVALHRDDGGQGFFSDKVFLLSRVEVFSGGEGITDGEEPYEFYSMAGGNPSIGSNPTRVKNNFWFLRSPQPNFYHINRRVDRTGAIVDVDAFQVTGVAPAMVIV